MGSNHGNAQTSTVFQVPEELIKLSCFLVLPFHYTQFNLKALHRPSLSEQVVYLFDICFPHPPLRIIGFVIEEPYKLPSVVKLPATVFLRLVCTLDSEGNIL